MAWIEEILAVTVGIVVLGLTLCALWASADAPGISAIVALLAISTAVIWFGERRLAGLFRS